MKKNNYKTIIPNILTCSRIFLTPIIIILGILNKIDFAIILTIIGAFTDFLDGRLARMWNVVSLKGAKLDAIADKIFSIGIISSLAFHFKILWVLVILEIIIGSINLFLHLKTNKTNSLLIGKIKTGALFLTIIFALITYYFKSLDNILYGFIYMTINLQILSLISYIFDYYNDLIEDKKTEKIEKTIIVDNLQSIIYDYESDI